ncbi:CGNR zinc finger domain-containing protein [Actinokineospora sp. NBRC 105648]|uniref:CGNR zinc finger domain-containing protein n=1 Tax=Actinokineospora sp. NBRC 105648 TaxID=3032206 RepID=UPI0024A37908|nr:CGNR zinc finger domain-containing protein [Actinokineospora sp. NBRC 105648]GLZ38063.1 hypothetical protein Acsp05_16870 [Actinokineospora sp. NBRC 105648]
MHLNPYGADVVHLAAELANRRPTTVEELVDRCRAAGLVVEQAATGNDLTRTQAMLNAWESVVDATTEHERARLLNHMLGESAAHPRLTDHGDAGWHLHYRDHGVPLGSVLCAIISVGTALHLTGRGIHRLRRCAVTDCDTIFADTTRTGRKRYCTHQCANRDAVRRHRTRTSAANDQAD